MSPFCAICLASGLLWLFAEWRPRRRWMTATGDREVLSLEEMYSRHFHGALDRDVALPILAFMEENLEVPLGRLRPEDRLESLNWSCIDSQVDYLFMVTPDIVQGVPLSDLEERMRHVRTVGDYVLAVAGMSSPSAV